MVVSVTEVFLGRCGFNLISTRCKYGQTLKLRFVVFKHSRKLQHQLQYLNTPCPIKVTKLSFFSSLQSAWPWFGAIRHCRVVCSDPASRCLPLGLYPSATLLQRRLSVSDRPGQRTGPRGVQVPLRSTKHFNIITFLDWTNKLKQ